MQCVIHDKKITMKKGFKFSKETREKMSKAKLGHVVSLETREKISKHSYRGLDSENPSWKGDNIGYRGIHVWVKRKLGKPIKCENPECFYPKKDIYGRILLKSKRFVWANISGEYKRDLSDWHQLCTSCNHKDGVKKHERFIERRVYA